MKTNVTPGETPAEITVSMIDQDLKDGISKPEMAIKYGIKPWEVDEMFKHSLLKGRRPSRKKTLSFKFVDDTCEDAEVVAITSEDGDPVVVHDPNQITLEDAIDDAIESVEEVKDQMQETQEAILDMLSPTGFEPKTNKEFVDDLKEMNDRDDDLDEQSKSSGIGSSDNAVTSASSGDEEDPGGAGYDKSGKIGESKVRAELKEYKEAVRFLKDKLHEVNILNAKLLFTNKLFKEYVLNNNQKMKVVENFDRAQTVREIKLVYTTLAENFGAGSRIKKKSIKESAGGSSKGVGTTKPKRKIISEEAKVANRFKKLAGLI